MSSKKYWFKPLQFWKYFAFYYPITFWGYFITAFCLTAIIKVFLAINSVSPSLSITLISFAPWAIGLMVLLDIFCRIFGEYPAWWRKKK